MSCIHGSSGFAHGVGVVLFAFALATESDNLSRMNHNEGAAPDLNRQPDDTVGPSLSERTVRYKQEIEVIVRSVGEHPLCEMKRACSLKNLAEKIEFVKDIQSIATSRIQAEKFLVIGADAATKSFHAVQNIGEFDEAPVRQLLEKYLSPVPDFEIFQLESSDGTPYILFVIQKQRRRRILAKVSVDDPSGQSPKVLLRAGDLWTKGGSTGKRLATPEDWDEIYEDIIESEAERRTRQRTAHAVDLAMAREKVRPGQGQIYLPTQFTDEEFRALMEELCGAKDAARFRVLLERLRDELVEGWHDPSIEEEAAITPKYQPNPSEMVETLRNHIKNVFRPAMHWLTLAGLYIIKNTGPVEFLDAAADLLKEVFETSYELEGLRSWIVYTQVAQRTGEHLSHTVPALESLVALYVIGAYCTQRGRFQYFRSLFRPDVYRVGGQRSADEKKTLMAFWPLRLGNGEPEELNYRAGRINYCARRITTDSPYLRLFGSGGRATVALCQFEFCLEVNSYLATPNSDTAESYAYVTKTFPDMYFTFWPSLIAFPLENIIGLASALLTEIGHGKPQILSMICFDLMIVSTLLKPGGDMIFARSLGNLASDSAKLHIELHHFPPMIFWPPELDQAMKASRKK